MRASCLAIACLLAEASLAQSLGRTPNFIVILADDLGIGDIGVYGATSQKTPRLDRMAAEGLRFTDFYVSSPVCSPSRAALLTGCYPVRVGITGVVPYRSEIGMHSDETLLPEMLKKRGYRTALFGKWHLGDHESFSPLRHGFDEFFGTPASNDMGPDMDLEVRRQGKAGIGLREGDETIELHPDQSLLTRRYTERAVRFIESNRDRPFFLYLAYNMPHTPIFASDRFRGRSSRGLYGDVLEEIDDSVGQVLDAVKRVGIDERTLAVFTSDNGPWLIFGDHGGSAGRLRGGKKQTFDGGVRVPAIIRWPGVIAAGRVSSKIVTVFDLLPTFAKLADAPLPQKAIDGIDLTGLLRGEANPSLSRRPFFYYWNNELRAVRSGRWKLQFPHVDHQAPDPAAIGFGGKRGKVTDVEHSLALYDLEQDPGESKNVAAEHPSVVGRLERLADQARSELGDSLTGAAGAGLRPAGRI